MRIIAARFDNGRPLQFVVVVVSGTFTANSLNMTGNMFPPRSWFDANANRLPDCDLASPVANGECGAFADQPVQNITVSATRAG